MKSFCVFIYATLLVSLVPAQSLGLKQLSALGGYVDSPTGLHLQHNLGAVAATVIQAGDTRLDQGMFLACDWPCADVANSQDAYLNPGITISPNPTYDALQLIGAAPYLHRYELYSPNGQRIAEGSLPVPQVSLARFPSGVYLLRVFDRQGTPTFVGKVVKH